MSQLVPPPHTHTQSFVRGYLSMGNTGGTQFPLVRPISREEANGGIWMESSPAQGPRRAIAGPCADERPCKWPQNCLCSIGLVYSMLISPALEEEN